MEISNNGILPFEKWTVNKLDRAIASAAGVLLWCGGKQFSRTVFFWFFVL
jgi:hypothetical protein